MSFRASCWIIFKQRPVSYLSLIRSLVDNGWTLSLAGQIQYMVEGSKGIPDYPRVPAAETEQVLEILRAAEQKGELLGIDLYWQSPPTGILVTFNVPDAPKVTGRDHLYFSCIQRRVLLSDRDDERLTNRSWYESRVIPVLEREGCDIESVEWYEGIDDE